MENEDELFRQEFLDYALKAGKHYSDVKVVYSGRFSNFNASLALRGSVAELRMSSRWKGISREIRLGLALYLLSKIVRRNLPFHEINLYKAFMKNLAKSTRNIGRVEADPSLEVLFREINEEYFNGMMGMPNIKWGLPAHRTFGHYSFSDNTVVISSLLKGERELAKYVLFHELLHKKHGFSDNGRRRIYHSRAFREEERHFRNYEAIEKRLGKINRSHRRKKNGFGFFLFPCMLLPLFFLAV